MPPTSGQLTEVIFVNIIIAKHSGWDNELSRFHPLQKFVVPEDKEVWESGAKIVDMMIFLSKNRNIIVGDEVPLSQVLPMPKTVPKYSEVLTINNDAQKLVPNQYLSLHMFSC